jgi:hypothetical protein
MVLISIQISTNGIICLEKKVDLTVILLLNRKFFHEFIHVFRCELFKVILAFEFNWNQREK